MKALKIFSVILLCAITFSSFGQGYHSNATYTTDSKSVISFHPFSFFASNFKLGFEQKMSDKCAVKGIALYGLSDRNVLLGVDDYTGYGIEGQVKYFPFEKGPAGFYGALFFYDKFASFTTNDYQYDYVTGTGSDVIKNYKMNASGGGVLFGGQMFVAKKVSIDFYGGGGPNIPSGDYASPSGQSGVMFNAFGKGIKPHFGFDIGLAL